LIYFFFLFLVYYLFMTLGKSPKKIHNHRHRLDFDFSCYKLEPSFRYRLYLTPESLNDISGELSGAIPIFADPGGEVAGFIISSPALLRNLQQSNSHTTLLIGKTYRMRDPAILFANKFTQEKMGDGNPFVGVKALCRELSALDVRVESQPSGKAPDSSDYRTART